MSDAADQALQRFVDRLRRYAGVCAADEQAILGLKGRIIESKVCRDLGVAALEPSYSTLVMDGAAARFDEVAGGSRQITAICIAGDMCDLSAVMAPARPGGLIALRQSKFYLISHRDLRELIDASPTLAIAFWGDTALDGAILAKALARTTRMSGRARTANILCEIGLRMELAGVGRRTCYELHLTQVQFGEFVGLTPIHVNRTLKHLRDEGLVAWRQGNVLIRDWDRLSSEGQFDGSYLSRIPLEERPIAAGATEMAGETCIRR